MINHLIIKWHTFVMQFSIFAKYSINQTINDFSQMISNINFFFSINEYFQCDCFTRYIFDIDIFIVEFRKLYEFHQKHRSNCSTIVRQRQRMKQIQQIQNQWNEFRRVLAKLIAKLKQQKQIRQRVIQKQQVEQIRIIKHQVEKIRIIKKIVETFSCRRCSAKFVNNTKLHQHIRDHHAKKPKAFMAFKSFSFLFHFASISITFSFSSVTSPKITWAIIAIKLVTSKFSRLFRSIILFFTFSQTSSQTSILKHQFVKHIKSIKFYFIVTNFYVMFHE